MDQESRSSSGLHNQSTDTGAISGGGDETTERTTHCFYADVHVPGLVVLQLRRRGMEILPATEEGSNTLPDAEFLVLATSLSRVM